MKKDILYSLARTTGEALIHANDARKGEEYACLTCNGLMLLRRGERKRAHFAHKSLSPNCTPESALHSGFKRLLFERLQACLGEQVPLGIEWECEPCCGRHEGNLLKRAAHVAMEHNVGSCRPDVALLGGEGQVVAAIEIVVSHPPEEATVAYYKQNSIPLVIFKLVSDTEITRVNETVLKPDLVDICLNPRCKRCGEHLLKKGILITEAKCERCSSPMKFAELSGEISVFRDFNLDDISIVRSRGVLIKSRYCEITHRKYWANTCTRCHKTVDRASLNLSRATRLNKPKVEINTGYFCRMCIDSQV